MSFLSSINPFGPKKVETPETTTEVASTVNTSSVPSAPEATVAAPSTTPIPAEVTGTVKEVERKFEWNVGRLLYKQPGESNAKAWAVRVLSVLFVIPLVLTAIVDLGRRAAFATNLCDGRSWSLIDKVTGACKAAADKASSVFKSTPKNPTLEDLNKQSDKALKSQVTKLVDGYKALNGGYLSDNGSFSTPTALNAEKQIANAQKAIVETVNTFIARNVTNTEDFTAQLDGIEGNVRQMINETAGDDFYVENKVQRTGPRPLLADKAYNELINVLEGTNQPILATQFVGLALQEPDVAQSLKLGVDQEILTPEQAKEAIYIQAPISYVQGLEEGLSEANNAAQGLLDSAVKNKLVTQSEADAINGQIQPEVVQLAAAAAKDVARKHTALTTDELNKQQLVKAADQLILEKRLNPKDKSVFLTEAESRLSAAKDAAKAESVAQRQAQELVELHAKQEAAAAEVARLAEVQKAADQTSLLGKFKEFLGLISKKQVELNAQFAARDELDAVRQQITDQRIEIRKTPVTVNGKVMTVFQASEIYNEAVDKISSSKVLLDAQKTDQIRDLVTQGFDQKTIDLIKQLEGLTPKLQEKLVEMTAVSEKIKAQYDELSHLIGVYKVYAKSNKDLLVDTNRKEVKTLERKVYKTQEQLNTRYNELFTRGIINTLRAQPSVVVNVDPTGNKEEVDALLKAYEESLIPPAPAPAVPEVPTAPVRPPRKAVPYLEEKSSVAGMVWNGGKAVVTAPFKGLYWGAKQLGNSAVAVKDFFVEARG